MLTINDVNTVVADLGISRAPLERVTEISKSQDEKIVEMRLEMIAVIDANIVVLEGGKKSQMLKKVRNGYRVCIGYGANNQKLTTEETHEIDPFEFHVRDFGEAIAYLNRMKPLFEAGQADDNIRAYKEASDKRAGHAQKEWVRISKERKAQREEAKLQNAA